MASFVASFGAEMTMTTPEACVAAATSAGVAWTFFSFFNNI
jgi:hypothetical protein